jgi:hypothetical protein
MWGGERDGQYLISREWLFHSEKVNPAWKYTWPMKSPRKNGTFHVTAKVVNSLFWRNLAYR